ncbi:hypothetical protein ACFL34_04710 [Candidatus Sumerlaeota bacterium]
MAERVVIGPTAVEQDGPGVDVSTFPSGIAVRLADPNPDLAYARNMVTLTFDLEAFVNVRLNFSAREFGDEPHLPKNELGVENTENIIGFGPVAEIEAERTLVAANRELTERFEQKIQATLARSWGEES